MISANYRIFRFPEKDGKLYDLNWGDRNDNPAFLERHQYVANITDYCLCTGWNKSC